MKARHILGLAVLMAVAGSCKKNQNQDTNSFSASIEVDESRTYLDDMKVKWTLGDQIIVYGNGAPKAYTLSTGDGTQTATFTTTGGVQPTSTYRAFYPAASCMGVSGDVFTFTMPDTQTYTANGFMNNLNPMAAKNDGNGGTTLGFRNAFAILKVSATGNNCAITSIELTTTGNAYQLSGTFTFDYINKATSLSSGTGNTITLSGISTTLTSTAQPFYFVVPPQALANGFSVTFKNGNTTIGSDVIITADQVTSNYTLAPNKIFQLGTSSSPLYVEAQGIRNLLPNVTSSNWYVSSGVALTDSDYGTIDGVSFDNRSSGEVYLRPRVPSTTNTALEIPFINGHVYYVRFYVMMEDYGGGQTFEFFWPEVGGCNYINGDNYIGDNNKWKMYSKKFTASYTSGDYSARIDFNSVGNNPSSRVSHAAGAMLIDLTAAGLASTHTSTLDGKPYFYGITPSW